MEVLLKKLLLAFALALVLTPWAAAAPAAMGDVTLQSSCASARADNGLLELPGVDPVVDVAQVDLPVWSVGGPDYCTRLNSNYCTYRWNYVEQCCYATYTRPGAFCGTYCP